MEKENKNKIVVGVLGLPISKDKKFFLTRRHSPKRPAWHNMWQVAGGELEFGEKPIETLKREMMEELQVKVDVVSPHPIIETSIWYGHELDQKQDTQIILIVYIVDIKNQTPNVNADEETSEGKWFSYKEISKLKSLPLTDEIVKKAYNMCNKYALWRVIY